MRYATLGSTGLVVSRRAFGAMTFTAGNRDVGSVDEVGAELADELVGRALERGHHVRRHRRRLRRRAVRGAARPGAGRRGARGQGALPGSLQLVGLAGGGGDGDPAGPGPGPVHPRADALLAAGAGRGARRAADDGPLRAGHDGVEPAVRRLPVRHVHPGVAVDPDNRFSGFDLLPFDKEHGFAVVEPLREIAAGHGATVAQVALAWLLARPGVTGVPLGSAKATQLAGNLGALGVRLGDADRARLDEATPLAPVYPDWYVDGLVDEPTARALGR